MNPTLQFIIPVALWGTIGTVLHWVHYPSVLIVVVRSFLAFFTLWFYLRCIKKRSLDMAGIKANLKPMTLCAASMALSWAFFFESFHHTTVAVGTVCYYLSPIFLILYAPIGLGENLTKRKVIAVLIAFAGLVLVSGATLDSIQGGYGIFLSIMGAIFAGIFTLVNKKITKINPLDATVFQMGCAGVVFLPYALFELKFDALLLDCLGVILIVILAVVHTAFAYVMFLSAMRRISAQDISILLYLDPMIAVCLSFFLLREPLSITQFFGIVFILFATYLGEKKKT